MPARPRAFRAIAKEVKRRYRPRRRWLAAPVLLFVVIVLSARSAVPAARADSPPSGINPVELIIPAIGVDASVQDQGLADDGSMGVPDNFTDAAWYDLGYAPGQDGNAIFTGHVSSTDAPGVFYNIEYLQQGDTISVIGDDGTELDYTVQEVDTYSQDSVPLDQLFTPMDQPGLVLITCGGDWDPVAHLFSNRIVVYATLPGS